MADEEEPPTEAEQYFASLDYALTSKGVIIRCDNCGYPMDPNETWRHKLSGARKCSSEMALQIANGTASLDPSSVPDDEWKLMEEYHQAKLRAENPPAKAFAIPKPSWIERLLQKLR